MNKLRIENENLITDLNNLLLERRDLAIMNVLLIDRLNNNYNPDDEEYNNILSKN